jgi:hypothetical protein
MARRLLPIAVFATLASVALFAQAEKFEGELKADRGKLKQVKRIALVDVVGETKNDMAESLESWTTDAHRLMIEAWKGTGVEVVAGPEVAAAFETIVPVPSVDEVKRVMKKKTKWTDDVIERTAQNAVKMWGNEPGEAAKYGFKLARPEGSINLERPLLSEKDPSGDKPEEKEVQKRVAELAAKLGVDAVARIDYGFGTWRYEDPGYVKANKAQGKGTGLLDGIKAIRGLTRGARATAHFNIEVFSADGKKFLAEIMGSCNSKEGTGMAVTGTGNKVAAMMPGAVSGCITNIFAKLADN